MEKLVSTYGKTFHTWHTDKDFTLPLGTPMLMMGFTKDGQLNQNLLKARDKRFDISTNDIKKSREDILPIKIEEGADAWENGEVKQLDMENMHK